MNDPGYIELTLRPGAAPPDMETFERIVGAIADRYPGAVVGTDTAGTPSIFVNPANHVAASDSDAAQPVPPSRPDMSISGDPSTGTLDLVPSERIGAMLTESLRTLLALHPEIENYLQVVYEPEPDDADQGRYFVIIGRSEEQTPAELHVRDRDRLAAVVDTVKHLDADSARIVTAALREDPDRPLPRARFLTPGELDYVANDTRATLSERGTTDIDAATIRKVLDAAEPHIALRVNEEYTVQRALWHTSQPEVTCEVAMILSEDADWEAVAAWCGGKVCSGPDGTDSGEWIGWVELPDGQTVGEGGWISVGLDGVFRTHQPGAIIRPGRNTLDDIRHDTIKRLAEHYRERAHAASRSGRADLAQQAHAAQAQALDWGRAQYGQRADTGGDPR